MCSLKALNALRGRASSWKMRWRGMVVRVMVVELKLRYQAVRGGVAVGYTFLMTQF